MTDRAVANRAATTDRVAGLFWFAGAAALAVCGLMFWRRTTREAATNKEEFSPQIGTSVAAGEIAYGEDKEGSP